MQMFATAQIAIFVSKDIPASSVDEFMAYARKAAKEGKPVSYASVGPGSFYHLLGEQLDMSLAPYGRKYDELHKQGKLKANTETLSEPTVCAGFEVNSLLMPKPLPAVSKAYADGIAQFRGIAKSINLEPQ